MSNDPSMSSGAGPAGIDFWKAWTEGPAGMFRPTGPASFGEFRDRLGEAVFLTVYGSPFLQAAVELAPRNESPRRRPDQYPAHEDDRQSVVEGKAESARVIRGGGR